MKPAFPHIQSIAYEEPASQNPLAFRFYPAAEIIEGKAMQCPWDDGSNFIAQAGVRQEYLENLINECI
jgi:hypothetical protein